MMKNRYIFLKSLLFVLLLHGNLFADNPSCLSNIDHEKIKENLKNNGSHLITDCADDHPNLFIAIVNLDDPQNSIAITHASKTSEGYPLKNITEHAKKEESITGNETILAVNGFTWEAVDSLMGSDKYMRDIGYYRGGYASRPNGTVYSKGNVLYTRGDSGEQGLEATEAVIGFSKNEGNGTKAKLFDMVAGEPEINSFYAFNVDNTSTSIMKYGNPTNIHNKNKPASSFGVGNYNGEHILVVLSPNGWFWEQSFESHYEIFKFFGVTDAISLDGGTAASLYYKGIHRNPISGHTILTRGSRDIMYALTVSREEKKICEDSYQPVTMESGAIEVILKWTCADSINMDLGFVGDNVIKDIADVENLGLEHAYVANQSDIYPGAVYGVSATGEKIEESELEESYLEDNPINIYAVIKTPVMNYFKQYEVRNFNQLNLGEFATIEIEEGKIKTVYQAINSSDYETPNPRPYVRTYNDCTEEEKKYSCQCVPCKYIVRGMEGAVEYGPIAGASVEIIRADTYGSATPNVVYRGETTNDSDLFKSGLVKLTQSDYDKFEDDVYYIVEAIGGEDLDRDDDLVRDTLPTENNGTIHAIIKGSDLKSVAFRVNVLTEAIYQTSGDLLGSGYNAVALNARLAEASKKLFKEKTFILDNELEINYHDVLLWAPGADKKKLLKPYDIYIEPIIIKTYANEPRIKESYRLIYEKLDSDAPQLAPLAVEIPYTIPSNSTIGKVNIESQGVSGIDHIALSGDDNNVFTIDNQGIVKVVDTSGFIIGRVYRLDMTAVGMDGKEGITMELVVKVVEGEGLNDPNATVPTLESVALQDVIENSVGGTFVGEVKFVDSASNIVSYKISGEDKDAFVIDNNGQITVADGADIDYEQSDTKHIKLSAINEAGNESFPIAVSIKVINEIDTPLYDLIYLINLSENVPIGIVVGQIAQSREGKTPVTSFDILNPNVPFAIDLNGTIRTTGYIDYEQNKQYTLFAMAKTESGNSNKIEIQISIDDIEPETGKPIIESFHANVDENAQAGTIVGQLNIDTDSDTVQLIQLQGIGSSNFTVDSNSTIRVANGATLDYEQKSSYLLQAIAYTSNESSDLISVNITLNNLNDTTPTLLAFNKNLEENVAADSIVGVLKIDDVGESNISHYTLTGEGSENFTVDTNGTIRVSFSAHLDYEITTKYTLEATVVSDLGESNPVAVNIYMLNLPDTIPFIGDQNLSIDKNMTDQRIGKINTIITDSPILEFEITGEGSENFLIDANGMIFTTANANFEYNKVYHLSVRAINSTGYSNTAAVLVTIKRVSFHAPIIEGFETFISSTTASHTQIGSINIVDYGSNDISLQYSLTGIGSENFYIEDGRIYVADNPNLQREMDYNLTVNATNEYGTAQANIIIHIPGDPVIEGITIDVPKNTPRGSKIGQIKILTDGESNITSFEIVSLYNYLFKIDNNGYIYISHYGLDFESNPQSQTFDVIAKNAYATSNRVTVTVNILDWGTNPIVKDAAFVKNQKPVANLLIGKVEVAYDGDSPITNIHLEGERSENFTIDEDGNIRLYDDLPNEDQVYNLKVYATNKFAQSLGADVYIALINGEYEDSGRPFITKWKTDNSGDSEDNQISLVINPNFDYNYTIDWGDSQIDYYVTGDINHTYNQAGTYTVTINGHFPSLYSGDNRDRDKLISIEQWGDIKWLSMAYAFAYMWNNGFTINAQDTPNLTYVVDMTSMCDWNNGFTEDISNWDVSNIRYMRWTFAGATNFNQNISSWDVSNTIDMSSMFEYAYSYNQDISNWNVSNVTDISCMFYAAYNFNRDISRWDVSNVTDMSSMFEYAYSFNQDISSWDISKVIDMDRMFDSAYDFNQDISQWDVSNVQSMGRMFYSAQSFSDQNLSNWNVLNVRYHSEFMTGAGSGNTEPIWYP